MMIKKRDNHLEVFDETKIRSAIERALLETQEDKELTELSDSEKLTLPDRIVNDVISNIESTTQMNTVAMWHCYIEDVQNTVEKMLMKYNLFKTAKAYILYRERRHAERSVETVINKIAKQAPATPWGPLGYITYKRTYSRKLAPDHAGESNMEEFEDTVKRVISACQTQLNINFSNDELKRLYKYLIGLKFSVAGRFLWQLGTHTVSKHGLASLQNCAFVNIDSPIQPFTWIFDMLMLGVGVGFNIQKHNVSKIPPVHQNANSINITRCDTKDADFIIPDCREGWVKLLHKTLKAMFETGKGFTYSTVLIRGAGAPIEGFGGVASGPDDLCTGMNSIISILKKRAGKQLSSVDCLDIVNIIASIVVAGNIRRSACIAIGDADDIEYLHAKRWDLGNIPNWRAFSNNSVVCSDIKELPDIFWEGYKGNGEPYGLINLNLARSIGRTKDGCKYPDPDVQGFNPCAEQGLANLETCCLSEIFLPNISSFDEMKDIVTFAYRICKHSLLLPCHHPGTQDIVRKNMRMGIGITGYLQATEEQKGWLSPLYEYLREYDDQYSDSHGIPRSVKLTTTKPSGTLSLLAGVTPGAHPGIYPYFIRRIRISADNKLIELCTRHGYPCEYQVNFDGSYDHKTMVVSFPCRYPEHTRFAQDMTAIDQLEVIKKLQHDWSDNAVSVTIYYKRHELDDIKTWLANNYTHNLKTVSFLLHNDHGFRQAPYEEITKEQYEELVNRVTPITSGNVELDEDYTLECASGACPVK